MLIDGESAAGASSYQSPLDSHRAQMLGSSQDLHLLNGGAGGGGGVAGVQHSLHGVPAHQQHQQPHPMAMHGHGPLGAGELLSSGQSDSSSIPSPDAFKLSPRSTGGGGGDSYKRELMDNDNY